MNDADYKPPFALTAKLNKLIIKVDRPQLSSADIRKLQEAIIEPVFRRTPGTTGSPQLDPGGLRLRVAFSISSRRFEPAPTWRDAAKELKASC